VKLLSGDPAWWSLTALRYHYWTQPLPTPLAWYVHQLPGWFQALSAGVLFVIELLAPLLAMGPRAVRHPAAWSLLALQLLIALTGNYAFFNLLTAALTLLLFDPAGDPPAPSPRAGRVLLAGCGLMFALGGQELLATLGVRLPLPPLDGLRALAAPFSIVNRYGLFAVMTTSRPEIVIEGSADGVRWEPYRFRYKPGDPLAAPRLVAPHQPRLDWQMWFAALGTCEENPWLERTMARLLEGSPPVPGLFAGNPFPGSPPAHVRAVLYDYRFTHPGEPGWWHREYRGLYCPTLSNPPSS
jgi:hypothetical protein